MSFNQFDNSKSAPNFQGFALPTSNTTYTPNQFFDVCLPHYSRGCVRIVSMLIRLTLGWCDEDGDPQVVRHLARVADFQEAGISRDMVRSSLNEAIEAHFIQCVRQPEQQKAGQAAVSGIYELKWDGRPEYVKDPKRFRGFFAGEGNRTYIPNQFFDVLIPGETLAVAKIVGSVIRLSIGFQNKWGHRRQRVALSFQHIQNYSRMGDRKTLSAAIRHAMECNYIERLEEGYFDPNAGKHSKAAVYAVKWLNQAAIPVNGRKTLPGENEANSLSEIPTGNGWKSLPEQRSEIPTDIEIKQANKTLKQQISVNDESAATFEILKEAGFDKTAARAMALKFSFGRVESQIGWIDQRNAKRNRLGLLRRAIEENWPAPSAGKLGQPNRDGRRGESFEQAMVAMEHRLRDQSSTS
ncbi:MAG: hypothetical protein ABSH22_12175 [Tepidisphaeraceae bacterium]|jgi:hypothetical protein